MITEYIRYRLKEHSAEQLISAYTLAAASLAAAPECLGYDLTQCVEEPLVFVLRIQWTSAEGHMQDFRKGPHFPPFLQNIRPFIAEIEEMRHYHPTTVQMERPRSA